MNEIWKDIVGYEGLYQVSNLGRVRSLDRVIEVNFSRGLKLRTLRGKVLAPQKYPNGYRFVIFGHKGPSFLVHRLVAQAFLPNPDGKPQVNHKNFSRSDNRLSNLEWVTESENQLHSRQEGVLRKEGTAVVAIENGIVLEFRTMTLAAEHFNCSRPHIANCIRQGRKLGGAILERAA